MRIATITFQQNAMSQMQELQAALKDLGADIYVVESQGELTLARAVAALRGIPFAPKSRYMSGVSP